MKTKSLALTAMFIALIIALGPLAIILPLMPIPTSLAITPIYLYEVLLPKRNVFSALAVYLMLGAAGLPVLSQFRGGLGIPAGLIGGFLLAYLVTVFVIALLLEKLPQNCSYSVVIVFSVAPVIRYTAGCLMFMAVVHADLAKTPSLTIIPFVPLDLAETVFAAVAILALKKVLYHAKLLPLTRIKPITTYTT